MPSAGGKIGNYVEGLNKGGCSGVAPILQFCTEIPPFPYHHHHFLEPFSWHSLPPCPKAFGEPKKPGAIGRGYLLKFSVKIIFGKV
jgi:hypothetical protein